MNDATPTIEELRDTPRSVGGPWARRLFFLLLALSLDRVRWGILETDGKISFIPAEGGQVLGP